MPIPFHTFDLTGEPIVDDITFLRNADRCYSYIDWFKDNSHVFLHSADEIIRDAEPYKQGDGGTGHGIYVLVSDNEIAYVGKALAIWDRLRSHRRSGKEFDRYWCFGGVPYDYLSYVESHYIALLKPYLNRGSVTGSSSVDRIARDAIRRAAQPGMS